MTVEILSAIIRLSWEGLLWSNTRLFCPSVNNEEKKFLSIDTKGQHYKNLIGP